LVLTLLTPFDESSGRPELAEGREFDGSLARLPAASARRDSAAARGRSEMADERQWGLAAERGFRAGLRGTTSGRSEYSDAAASESGCARITLTGAVRKGCERRREVRPSETGPATPPSPAGSLDRLPDAW
jgi:hypothetical protein